MQSDFDLAIVGSGFGGSLLSMVARRLGLSVVLLERGKHPRFAIGESTSPLMNLLVEQIALRYDLPRLLPLTTFGSWQRTYPDVVCGLKRGFTYYHHEARRSFRNAPDRSTQLLVAASPSNEVSDMHWLRADVDHFLVREAISLGVEYLEEAQLDQVELGEEAATLSGEWHGQPFRVRARLIVDASGPRGFLSRALSLPEMSFPGYPPTQTLFSHFANVPRCDQMDAYQSADIPPYPPDDAALHHVFDGGWMWVLRFGNGVTSAGIAVQESLAEEWGLSEGAAAWPRFLAQFPTIHAQFADAEAIRPFVYTPRLSYRCAVAAGEGWTLLPSAAAFVDPLFSTGMPLTLLGIERLGRILEEAWESPHLNGRLQEYGRITLAEADGTAQFIRACYAAMPSFPHFAAFSMFYFAAASFSEMARRLERSHLVRRFLAADHLAFSAGLRDCAARLTGSPVTAEDDAGIFAQEVAERIACLNVAGLCDPIKRNWYPVDLEDVVHNAEKLGYTPETMAALLTTAPWAKK
ncbi:MAG TPA: tryptophan 7-halogenase [Chthonomonadaceae bacterium]|nr:tryptophan 7-halogenase [Chthonomonadaceae bacterium]